MNTLMEARLAEEDTENTRIWICRRLLELPQLISLEENRLLMETMECRRVKNDLADEEANLTLRGLPGKNAEERSAYLRRETAGLRSQVEIYWRAQEAARIALARLQNELSALRSVARMIGGEEH